MLLYYNKDYQLDSARWTSKEGTSVVRYQYDNGNLVSRQKIDEPCCRINTLSEAAYDNGINPSFLLKKASNNFGLDEIFTFFPTAISVNNLLESKVRWEYRASEEDPRIILENVEHTEYSYEYYPNSNYPKMRRHTLSNGDVSDVIFFYEACQ